MTFANILYAVGIGSFVVFFFGLCIFVHEFGHLVAALWRGLHVERFSVGFGQRIWGFKRNGVDYIIGWIPFGGYVALPQLEPSDTPQTSDGRPLPHAKPLDRIITAFAGPFFNVIFAFILGTVVWHLGVMQPASSVSCSILSVPETSAEYQAGLRPNDRVTAVNGQKLRRGWNDLFEKIILSTGSITLTVERQGKTQQISYPLVVDPKFDNLPAPQFKVRMPAMVQALRPGSPAEAAGLKRGDLILKVNGNPAEDSETFIKSVQTSDGKPMDILVERDGQPVNIAIVAKAVQVEGKTVYQIGAEISEPSILTHPTPLDQAISVFTRTRDTLRALFAPHSQVKPKHLSGPIGIATGTAITVYHDGVRAGLAFIVFVSFSLAFFNLLPIPVLDGGHITLALMEAVTRRTLPVKLVNVTYIAFASVLISFMLYVTFYDVKRLPWIWSRIRPDAKKEQPVAPTPATPSAATATQTESPLVPNP